MCSVPSTLKHYHCRCDIGICVWLFLSSCFVLKLAIPPSSRKTQMLQNLMTEAQSEFETLCKLSKRTDVTFKYSCHLNAILSFQTFSLTSPSISVQSSEQETVYFKVVGPIVLECSKLTECENQMQRQIG
jgi:hypothetical protein